ncbi:LysR substrate-binding domain-containing protein [Thalassotalea piscium]
MSIAGSTLSGLATFRVAANFGSFTQAANYLHLTTGAVSQQISLLEERLLFQLFERHSRGIKLTHAGSELLRVIDNSFDDIQQTIEHLRRKPIVGGEVRLKLTPSFAFKWLVPRLQNFYTLYPDISIQTFAEGALVDHRNRSFDLAIDYGQSPYGYPHSTLLLAEQLLPVMSPSYYKRFHWQDTTEENINKIWQSVTLLHDAMPWQGAEKSIEWQYWFQHMNVKAEANQGHFFNRTDMAMAAAEAGLGVAMARYALVAEDFKQNRLVSPFKPIQANAGYYLIQHHSSPSTQCFSQWLQAQCN